MQRLDQLSNDIMCDQGLHFTNASLVSHAGLERTIRHKGIHHIFKILAISYNICISLNFCISSLYQSINAGFSNKEFPALASGARTGRRDTQRAFRQRQDQTCSLPPSARLDEKNRCVSDRRIPLATFRGIARDHQVQSFPHKWRKNWGVLTSGKVGLLPFTYF